jgi:SWI/SNF-related matrix-associated actin-dependent regulator of chromatin subfamily A-like protein 1
MYWVPGDLLQAEDRAHRVGQACAVECNYLLLSGSVDDRMWPLLDGKLRDAGAVLDGRRGALAVRVFCRSFV